MFPCVLPSLPLLSVQILLSPLNGWCRDTLCEVARPPAERQEANHTSSNVSMVTEKIKRSKDEAE